MKTTRTGRYGQAVSACPCPLPLIHTAADFSSFLRIVGLMYRIVLSSTQGQELEQVSKRTEEGRLRTRGEAVLMAAGGRARHEIAQDLGIHRTTVRVWVRS